jgi:hypothetical protein
MLFIKVTEQSGRPWTSVRIPWVDGVPTKSVGQHNLN